MAVEVSNMRQEMLALCRSSSIPPKEIFDNVCRSNPEAAVHLSYQSIQSIMNRVRAKSRPVLPKSLAELDDILQHDESFNLMYIGSANATDGNTALLFSSKVLLEVLAESKEIYVDGLCSVVPKDSHMSQLYTVHIRYMDKGICVIFALCEARTTALYCEIWKKIIEFAPGLKENLEFTMSDYERAALNALQKSFPRADVRCCWFHFKQAVTRKWKSLGLDEQSDLLSMTTSLPLVPQIKFEEALDILDDVGKNYSNDENQVCRFLEYIRSTWLPLASKVSVYECRLRTNNIVESFNNTAHRKLGGDHPNLWVFLNHLKNLIKDQELNLGRLRNNQAVGRARRRKDIERDAKIFQAQRDLTTGRLPLQQFLRMFGKRHEWSFEDPTETEENDDSQADVFVDDEFPEYVECEVNIVEEETPSDPNDEAGVIFRGNCKQDASVQGAVSRETSTEKNIERSAFPNAGLADRATPCNKIPVDGKRLPLVVLQRLTVSNVTNRTIEKTVLKTGSYVPSNRDPSRQENLAKRSKQLPIRYRV